MKFSEYKKKILLNNAEYQEAVENLNYQFIFGDAVLEARLEKCWSQTELARRAGTKQANISRIEAGMGNPTLDLIKRLCNALDLEINFQTRRKDPISPDVSTLPWNDFIQAEKTHYHSRIETSRK